MAGPAPAAVAAQVARLVRVNWGGTRYRGPLLGVSSEYGRRRSPKTGKAGFHNGMDLLTPMGTPIFSPFPGTVTHVARAGTPGGKSSGNAIYLKSGPWGFAWMHLDEALVRPGDTTYRGQKLGKTGRTGNVTGPHLHLEVTFRGQTIDPRLLYPSGVFAPRRTR